MFGYASIEAVQDREAAVKEREAALDDREAAVKERAARLEEGEAAVEQLMAEAQEREAGAEIQSQQAAAALEAAREESANVQRREQAISQLRDESRAIVWAAAILAAGVAAWSLWRLQPSTVARMNQRRRTAEQNLAAMQGERDEAQHELQKQRAP